MHVTAGSTAHYQTQFTFRRLTLMRYTSTHQVQWLSIFTQSYKPKNRNYPSACYGIKTIVPSHPTRMSWIITYTKLFILICYLKLDSQVETRL